MSISSLNFSLNFNDVLLESVSSTYDIPKRQDHRIMIEEGSSIGNPIQENPSSKYDTFSSKEKEAIVQRVKAEAISMGVISQKQFKDWEKVVIGLGYDIWKRIVGKIIRSFRPYYDLTKTDKMNNMVRKVKTVLKGHGKSKKSGDPILYSDELPLLRQRLIEVIPTLASKDFDDLREEILPFINELRAQSGREEKDDLFQKHYWSVFKRKSENAYIMDLWKALPRSNAKNSPAKISNLPTLSSDNQSTVASGSELSPNILNHSAYQALDNFVEDFKEAPEGFSTRSFFPRDEPTNFMNRPLGNPHFLSEDDEEIPEFEKAFPQSEFPFDDYETKIPSTVNNNMMVIEEIPKEKENGVLTLEDFENMCFEDKVQEYEDPFDRLTAYYLKSKGDDYLL